MSKKCNKCGAPAPDDNSVFCNRCGSHLPAATPADILTCRQCGKIFTDRQSHFCNRCGSTLGPEVQAASPVVPAAKGKNCPACGFENYGENRFYCKKCGAYIRKSDPIRKNEPAEKELKNKPKDPIIRIKPDDMDNPRQKPIYKPVEEPNLPRVQRKVVPQEPVYEQVKEPKNPRVQRKMVQQKREWGSYRRGAIVAAGMLALGIVIAVVAVSVPGILNAGAANSTAPGLLDGVPWGILLNLSPVINQSTPVINDTPLIPKVI